MLNNDVCYRNYIVEVINDEIRRISVYIVIFALCVLY